MDTQVRTQTKRALIKPLVVNVARVPESGIMFSAACFGGMNDKDWSLAPLRVPEDAVTHKQLAERVGLAVSGLGGKRAYSPSPTQSNNLIISEDNLRKILPVRVGNEFFWIYRDPEHPAEGTFLTNPGDAGIFSAAGCSVVVMTYGDTMIFAHAGRDCLVDRKIVETDGEKKSREHESVVYAMLEKFGVSTPEEFGKVHAWVFYAIKPEQFIHRFDNPEKGAWNAAAARYIPEHFGAKAGRLTCEGVEIDIPELAKAQLMGRGVPEENIHLEHGYLSDDLPTTRNGGGRYLVAIVRH